MYHNKVMDWPTSDSYHLNLKNGTATLHAYHTGWRQSDIPVRLVFKKLLTQSISNTSMEDHTYLQQHETFSHYI